MSLPFLWREVQCSLLTQFYLSLIPFVSNLGIKNVRFSIKNIQDCSRTIFSYGITSSEFLFAYQKRIDEFDTHKNFLY